MNDNTTVFVVVVMLFAFAITAFIYADYLYSVAFLLTIIAVMAIAGGRL